MNQRTIVAVIGVLVMMCALTVVEAGELGENPSLLLAFTIDEDDCRLTGVSLSDVDQGPRRLESSDDWRVRLVDSRGGFLHEARFDNPRIREEWRNGAAPVMLSVPRLDAAQRLEVRDERGWLIYSRALDDRLMADARQNRRQFLEFEDISVKRLAQRTAKSTESGTSQPAVSGFDALAEGQQQLIQSEILRAHQMLENRRQQVGPGARSRIHPLTARHLDIADVVADARASSDERHTLSGVVRDAESSIAIPGARMALYTYGFDFDYQGYIGTVTTEFDGSYSVTVPTGLVWYTIEPPSGQLYAELFGYTPVLADTSLDIAFKPGVLLSGRVTNPSGLSVEPVAIQAWTNYGFNVRVESDASGEYRIVVPRGTRTNFEMQVPVPYASPRRVELVLRENTVRDIVVDRGHVLSGTIRNESGQALGGSTVVLRHLGNASGIAWPMLMTSSDPDGSYSLAVPADVAPSDFVLSVHKTMHVRKCFGLSLHGDRVIDPVLRWGTQVKGQISGPSGEPVAHATVRFFRHGEYVISATSNSEGKYAIGLDAGSYDLSVSTENWYFDRVYQPVTMTGIEVDGPLMNLDLEIENAEVVLDLKFRYPNEEAAAVSGGVTRVEVREDGALIKATYGDSSTVEVNPVDNTWFRSMTLYLAAGQYQLRAIPLGSEPVDLGTVVLDESKTMTVDLPEPFVWNGVLRDAEGTALANQVIVVWDELAYEESFASSTWSYTDSEGRFRVPLHPGGLLKFYAPADGTSIKHVERVGQITGDRRADCVLERVVAKGDEGPVLSQIYGDSDVENHYNIVIIGDGFTDIQETFTDANGNGVWDGVLYTDLNLNGLYDGFPERYAVYGEAEEPEPGTDPTEMNEVFDDINQDGVPNFDDQAIFDEQAMALVRSLLGSDVWNAVPHLFNVYTIRTVSNQAGNDILVENEEVVLERDTALGAYVREPSRYFLLAADYLRAQQLVNRHAPFADTQIILVNQPVPIGRANAYIIMGTYPRGQLENSYVLSHEMGHNVGLLADEYTEYDFSYEMYELQRPNVTTFTDRAMIPWAGMITENMPIPTTTIQAGIGLFEGAYYSPGGIYRPTAYCSMNSGKRFCPVCARQLIDRITRLLGGPSEELSPIAPAGEIATQWPVFVWSAPTTASSFEIEVETVGDEQQVHRALVFSNLYRLGAILDPGVDYRWRIRGAAESVFGQWSPWQQFSISGPSKESGVGG